MTIVRTGHVPVPGTGPCPNGRSARKVAVQRARTAQTGDVLVPGTGTWRLRTWLRLLSGSVVRLRRARGGGPPRVVATDPVRLTPAQLGDAQVSRWNTDDVDDRMPGRYECHVARRAHAAPPAAAAARSAASRIPSRTNARTDSSTAAR